MLRLVNRARRQHGLRPLKMQDDLRKVAREHSKDMARLDYFEHKNFLGQSHVERLQEAKVTDIHSGENLAKIGGYTHPLLRAHQGLMNSPGHRANILNPSYNTVGIGIHRAENKILYFTQNFAKRALIFLKKPPSRIRRQKNFNLHFKPFGKISYGVYRISEGPHITHERGFSIHQGNNRLSLSIENAGFYKIELFTGDKNSSKFTKSNEIILRVRRGWFG